MLCQARGFQLVGHERFCPKCGNQVAAPSPQIVAQVPQAAFPERDDILARLNELEAAHDKPTILDRYNKLVAPVIDHITVLGFLLPPLLQHLLN